MATVDQVVRASIARAEALATKPASSHALLRMLQDAEADLFRRCSYTVEQMGGGAARFTEVQAAAYRSQIAVVTKYVKARLGGMTARQATKAIGVAFSDSVQLLAAFETRYRGVAQPLRIAQAAQRHYVITRTKSSLLRQHATSLDRYGSAMIGKFDRIMRSGLIRGASQDEMVRMLTGHGGPRGLVSLAARETEAGVERLVEREIGEGLFVRHKYWAERLVRTEVQHAYNAAAMETMNRAAHTDVPDMQKKILAVMDARTAYDSKAVHGQVRSLTEPFVDGMGRVYMHPPGRPNDRETVIPWRPVWSETDHTKPLPPAEVAAAKVAAMPKDMPAAQRRLAKRAAKAQAAASVAHQEHARSGAVAATEER